MSKERSAMTDKIELVIRDGTTGEIKRHIYTNNGKSYEFTAKDRKRARNILDTITID